MQNSIYFMKTLPLNLLKFISKNEKVLKPNCIVIGGKIMQKINFVSLDDKLEFTQKEKKYIKQ